MPESVQELLDSPLYDRITVAFFLLLAGLLVGAILARQRIDRVDALIFAVAGGSVTAVSVIFLVIHPSPWDGAVAANGLLTILLALHLRRGDLCEPSS